MNIFRTGVLLRKTIKTLVTVAGIFALEASQHAAAVNLIDPDDHDWRWEIGAEPTFPNECYGEGDLCLVDTDDNESGKANDGDNQLFDVWVPEGAGPFPVFIHAHGGGFTGGSKKRMALAGPLLANDDVVFVTTNYRLEGQTPEGVLKSIDDVIALIGLLKTDENYKVNPEQIFIGGGSAGGVIMNDIAYKEKVTGIKGLWHWNLYLAESQPVDLRDTDLLESLALPVVHGHPEPYNTHNSHSARDAFDHAKLNWEVGNGGTFFKALNEHPSMIGYPDKDVPEAEAWDQIQQIWIDGEWHLNNDHNDLTIEQEWDLNSQSPTFEQPLAEPTIDTGVKMLNLAEWIYEILSSPEDDQVSDEDLLVDIQQLYIGILGRAADQPGLDYWFNEISTGSLTLENTRASFTHQVEYDQLYGDLDNSALVTEIYQNFLERSPDKEGLAYWVSELDSGSVNPDQLVNALINAVEDPAATSDQALIDKSVLNNKVTAAEYFTATFSDQTVGDNYLLVAESSVSEVNSNSGSVALSLALVDAALIELQTIGFNSMFIGHSFFIPIANTMPIHTEIAGIKYHTQTTVFSGGSSGAPEALWNDEGKSEDIRLVLDAGGIDFFAMTYHDDYPGLTGYTNWIDYALEASPDVHIALGIPWVPNPESYDNVSYRSTSEEFHAAIFHPLIDELRALYPNTDIYCIPYASGAVELRDLYAAGTLDDVEALVSDSAESIYNDTLGHADGILYSVVEMVWLKSIYGIDLSTYTYDPGYTIDVKAIAEKVMDEHDPAYNAPYL